MATVPQVFDLWQDPQERYDIFMNNFTERTWMGVIMRREVEGDHEDLREVSAAQGAELRLHGPDHALGLRKIPERPRFAGEGRHSACRCRPETNVRHIGRRLRQAPPFPSANPAPSCSTSPVRTGRTADEIRLPSTSSAAVSCCRLSPDCRRSSDRSALHTAQAQGDPLPSWNDGATKKSITDFVARVTTPGRPGLRAGAGAHRHLRQ